MFYHLLKKSQRGNCVHVVHGLGGGGDAAYKEALRRLKNEYGNREVMKAAHPKS